MKSPFFISPRVIDTINSLPMDDRIAVTTALAGEMIFGADATKELSPMQNLVFTIIRSYVKHDTNVVVGEC